MLAWMSYVIVVSLLLSLAALAMERSARVRQKPTRWLWGTSMIASLLVPLVISSVRREPAGRAMRESSVFPVDTFEQLERMLRTFAKL
jgi:hypothetical protein